MNNLSSYPFLFNIMIKIEKDLKMIKIEKDLKGYLIELPCISVYGKEIYAG